MASRSADVDLAQLTVEIRRRSRVRPPPGVDPLQEIMRRISEAGHLPENRTLLRVAAAIGRRQGNFDENEVWTLSQESLGLLDALIERTISNNVP